MKIVSSRLDSSMTIQLHNTPVSFLIRRSVRYLLVSSGFRLLQAIVALAALSFVLTGGRIAAIDQFGNRADIVASIIVTIATIALLRALNRRVMTAIDRRFFREAYNAQQILTELGEAIPTLSKTEQLVDLVGSKISDALHPANVTIFLDDEPTGAYVASFSLDESKAGVAMIPRPFRLVLHYDEGLINRLRESNLSGAVEFAEAAFLAQSPGLDDRNVFSEHERKTLRAVRSSLLIPIASNGRLHGLISLGQRLSDLPYTDEDKRLLLVVGHQIATFIENMKMISHMVEEERLAREVALAAEVQRHLFPADGLEDEALDIYGTCLPALGVGGDYYDYFGMDHQRTGIAIADVAGKGIGAALLMSSVQASLRCQLISRDKPLRDVVSSMNRLLRRSTADGAYATIFVSVFDKATRRLTYVNAGHNPPILVRGRLASRNGSTGLNITGEPLRRASNIAIGTSAGVAVSLKTEPEVEHLTTGGPIIGTFLDEPYEQETIQLRSGDTLFIYTDGVTEALNPAGVEFGENKLRSLLFEPMELSARELSEKIIANVLEWQGQAPQHDDITLIVVKVK